MRHESFVGRRSTPQCAAMRAAAEHFILVCICNMVMFSQLSTAMEHLQSTFDAHITRQHPEDIAYEMSKLLHRAQKRLLKQSKRRPAPTQTPPPGGRPARAKRALRQRRLQQAATAITFDGSGAAFACVGAEHPPAGNAYAEMSHHTPVEGEQRRSRLRRQPVRYAATLLCRGRQYFR